LFLKFIKAKNKHEGIDNYNTCCLDIRLQR